MAQVFGVGIDELQKTLANKRYFATEMERGIESLRETFRTENNIDPNAHVIFLSPGNERSEAEFCMETLRKGVKEFLLKYSMEGLKQRIEKDEKFIVYDTMKKHLQNFKNKNI